MTVATKRISKYLDSNREMYRDFPACFIKVTKSEEYDSDGYYAGDVYVMTLHENSMMPAFNTMSFGTIEKLAQQMKNDTGDLRKWRVVPYEWYS